MQALITVLAALMIWHLVVEILSIWLPPWSSLVMLYLVLMGWERLREFECIPDLVAEVTIPNYPLHIKVNISS